MRIRLISEPEWGSRRQENRLSSYDESCFFDLLREKGTFDDEASIQLLTYLHGAEAVAERWYSRVTPDGKPCLSAISQEAKYGLTVIANSRKGIYTEIVEDFTEFEVEARMEERVGADSGLPLVWNAFAALDMDILLVFRKKNFSFGWDIPVDNDFLLENYPGENGPMEVWVKEALVEKGETHKGLPCVHNYFYAQRYDWRKETDDLLEVLDDLNRSRRPLAKGMFSLQEFYTMMGEDWGCSDPDDDWEETARTSVKLVNHMSCMPDETEARRVRYLVIEKRMDGSYCLRGQNSVKYPEYWEMLDEAEGFAVPGGEVLVLPVDVNEVVSCARDLEKAVCAFRVTDGVVELFDKAEGLREFAALLQEALNSGKCTVPEDD